MIEADSIIERSLLLILAPLGRLAILVQPWLYIKDLVYKVLQ